MKPLFCSLLGLFLFLFLPLILIADDSITANDLAEAEDFAKTYYPIPTGADTWCIIDENGQAPSDLEIDPFFFEKIGISGNISKNVPKVFFGYKNDKWYLMVNQYTIKVIPVPEGYEMDSIISPGAYVLSANDGSAVSKLYNRDTNTFMGGQNSVSSYSGGIIVTSPFDFRGKLEEKKIILYDDNFKTIHERPFVSGEKMTTVRPPVEGRVVVQETPRLVNGRLDQTPSKYQTTIYDQHLNMVKALPNGWQLSYQYSDGLAVFSKKTNKYTDPAQFAIVDQQGKILLQTRKFITSGGNRKFSFIDLKTYLHGFIDEKGKEIFPARFESVTDFENGIAYATEHIKNDPNDLTSDGRDVCYELSSEGKILREIKG